MTASERLKRRLKLIQRIERDVAIWRGEFVAAPELEDAFARLISAAETCELAEEEAP